MRSPMLPQNRKRRMRKRNVAILGAFALVDVDHHTTAVDIRDFEVPRFLQPETTGVNRGEEGAVATRRDSGEDVEHLFGTEHGG